MSRKNAAPLPFRQPVDSVEWVPRDRLVANDYNPNSMPPPEFALLKVSILEDGWTQPIVTDREGTTIIDGFHRWTVAGDPEVAALTGGLVPIVRVDADRAHRIMSTVRHNRARGEHGVKPMAEIVRQLLAAGYSSEQIQPLLGMEDEEVERLADRAGMPEAISRTHVQFGQAWEPGQGTPNS